MAFLGPIPMPILSANYGPKADNDVSKFLNLVFCFIIKNICILCLIFF